MAKSQKKNLVQVNQSVATRKSAVDFGEASRSAKRIRMAFAQLVEAYGDQNIINRLNRIMVKMLTAIPSSMVGERRFADGYIKFLRGFRFSALREVGSLWPFPLQIELKPEAITVQLFKSHSPSVKGATHAVFQLMVANIDLIGKTDEIVKAKNLTVPIDQEFKPLKLNIPLNLIGDKAVFIAFGIHHLNKGDIMRNEQTFACDIVYAERIKDGHVVDFVLADQPPLLPEAVEDEGIEWETC